MNTLSVGCTYIEMLSLAFKLERFISVNGYHVGLTGSCIFNGYSNKDIELIIYPHKSNNKFGSYAEDIKELLVKFGLVFVEERTHTQYNDDKIVLQFEYESKRIDIFVLK